MRISVLCKTLVPWLCSRSQPGIKVIIRGLPGHLLHTVTFLVCVCGGGGGWGGGREGEGGGGNEGEMNTQYISSNIYELKISVISQLCSMSELLTFSSH